MRYCEFNIFHIYIYIPRGVLWCEEGTILEAVGGGGGGKQE